MAEMTDDNRRRRLDICTQLLSRSRTFNWLDTIRLKICIMVQKDRSDLNHKFPAFENFSRVLPGEERIHENVLVEKPITGPPDETVLTVYDVLKRAASISSDGPFLGELNSGRFVWKSYRTVLRDAQILGSALLHFGIKPGQETRVGIAGIHSVRYMTALHALVSYGMVLVPLYHNSKIEVLCDIINNCELEVIFCDNEARADAFVNKMNEGVIRGQKKLILLTSDGKHPNGAHSSIHGLEIYSYDYVYAIGEKNLRPVVPPTPSSTYIICFTSGTTGQPKGVQLSHRSLLAAMAGLYVQWVPPPNRFQFGVHDVYFSFLSLAHIYEHLMQTFTMYVGGRIGIYSGEVSKLLFDIKILQPTIVSLVPRLLNKFHDHIHAEISKKNVLVRTLFAHAKEMKLKMLHKGIQRYDTIWDKLVFKEIHNQFGGRLRMLTTGGAPVTPAVMDFTRIAYGCPLMEGYGQTECGAAATLNLPFDCTAGHVGGPAPWAQVKLIDVPEMNYAAADDKGEVCFRGTAVMDGYFMDEELSRKTVDEEGWLHTGDIGEWLPNGALKITDRKNALFKLAQGDFVSPEQIEAVYLHSRLIEQIFITGLTTRSFLVGVAVVKMSHVREAIAGRSELSKCVPLTDRELLSHADIRQFVLQELNRTAKSKNLQSIELIRNIHLIAEEFTAESGLVTPTLKLRRHLLKQRFAKEIENMYTEIPTL